MRRLIILAVIVLAAGGVADLSARAWAQGQIDSRAKAEVPSQVTVHSHIKSLPFLPPLLLGGKVSEADAHFTNVPAGPLTLAVVDIELHGVRIDRHALFNDRRVRLVDISSGKISVEITAEMLTKVLHVPVSIANGQVHATVAGATINVRVQVVNNALVLSSGVVSLHLDIPKTRLVPCASDATVLAGRVRLTCSVTEVPPALLEAANKAASQ